MTKTSIALAARSQWRSRTPRERLVLSALAVLLAFAALLGSGYHAYRAGEAAERRVVTLAAEVAAMRRDALQLQGLRNAPAKALPEGLTLRDVLVRRADELQLGDIAKGLRTDGQDRIHLDAEISFTRFVEWQASLQRDLPIRIERLDITPTAVPDKVRVAATLVRAES